ncbi:exonuclease SbcCD subunit D [Leptogranulimonas caecicola]|uniref:Nuclease SbcCD subunit D n=1 Tax=Leptogranulimonas caecicola TaxID=2894156 RepID=A0AAU9CPT1_9ACTN|nr:exonuclease SbcCD subunit D [Leptogranulimonas caecicola]BCV19266.1 nuclease SbcCD subunit D [Atopobiaceae bacterium P1]BDC91651.1 nuclease SbcCD subunit D [Leptogranulimonas caecicola]
MRLLHLSDLHAGKRVRGYSMEEELKSALAQVVKLCEDRAVDVVLLAGDLYDSAQSSDRAIDLIGSFLETLAEKSITVVATPGNHDSATRVGYGSKLLASRGVHVTGPLKAPVKPVVVSDEEGPVYIWPIPFVRPATVRAVLDVQADTYTLALRALIDAMNIDTTQRNVCVSHQFVTNGLVSPQRSESELSVGGTDNVDVSVYEPFDYVALGHLHRPQKVSRNTVRYAGSPVKYSVSEAAGEKSMVLVELGLKKDGVCATSIELVPIEPVHDLRKICGPLEELLSPEVLASAPADDYVYVTLTDDAMPLDAMGRLREAYPNLMGLELQAEIDAEDELPLMPVEAEASLEALFGEFFELQTGHSMSPEQVAVVEASVESLEA